MCVPQQPGSLHLVGPQTNGTDALTTPVTLSWQIPSPIGQDCAGNALEYQLFLSQTNPPAYYQQLDDSLSVTVAQLANGYWYWTVRVTSSVFFRDADEVFFFTVVFCRVLLVIFARCVTQRGLLYQILYPLLMGSTFRIAQSTLHFMELETGVLLVIP